MNPLCTKLDEVIRLSSLLLNEKINLKFLLLRIGHEVMYNRSCGDGRKYDSVDFRIIQRKETAVPINVHDNHEEGQ